MEFDIKTGIFIGSQIVIVATVISGNRHHIKSLNEANHKIERWVKELQTEVTNLRIKVGV
jgi:hypothetical protein